MSTQQASEPGLADLEQAIRKQIVLRTGNRIHGLAVEVSDGHIVVGGRAVTYHLKQLAIQGVFDVVGPWGRTRPVTIDVPIAVLPVEDAVNWAAR